MEKTILEVKNLVKTFGDFTAVDNISFSLKEGSVLGFLGPNGAGKTTTIQMLIDVLTPTSGEIIYFGKNFKLHREEILKQVSFASTYISLPWQFTIYEILDIFARLYSVKEKQKRITKLLDAFDIADLRNTNFFKLSAGQRTRVILAKSFLNYPKIILLDEPTASLDVEIATKVREFLKQEQQAFNTSILLTSHNMDEIEELCDNVIIVNHGKIIDQDTPENLARKISQCRVQLTIAKQGKEAAELLSKHGYRFEKKKHQFNLVLKENAIAEFLMVLANAKIEYHEITIQKPELEDYFIEIVEGKI